MVRLVVIKVNGKTQPYPTYRDLNCDNMSAVVSLSNDHSQFLYGGTGKTVINTKYEVEQTLAQIKNLCNKCCESTSA